MRKVWHKPLHKRKAWKELSLVSKTIYYMKPFVSQLLDTWLQPLPFPTIFKLLHSCALFAFMIFPFIYPIILMTWYYGIVQYFIESALDIRYPYNLDLIHYVDEVYQFKIDNEKYALFIQLYFERWRFIAAAFASCIDYMRLALSLVNG